MFSVNLPDCVNHYDMRTLYFILFWSMWCTQTFKPHSNSARGTSLSIVIVYFITIMVILVVLVKSDAFWHRLKLDIWRISWIKHCLFIFWRNNLKEIKNNIINKFLLKQFILKKIKLWDKVSRDKYDILLFLHLNTCVKNCLVFYDKIYFDSFNSFIDWISLIRTCCITQASHIHEMYYIR